MKNKNNSHLTAKEREKMSFPTKWLMRKELLKGEILDFGCGFGKDVFELKRIGYKCDGYDKYHSPDYPQKKYKTIICNYVLNVLPAKEQHHIVMQISQLLEPNGVAYYTVRRDVKFDGYRMHKIHKKTTFQCNVELPFESIFLNEFCEIYSFKRFVDNPRNVACIFCRPSSNLQYIAESMYTYAVFDGFPVSKGHALIIPKSHIPNFFNLSIKEQFHILILMNYTKDFLQKKYNPNGFNIGININRSAGQTIDHTHIHLIPRYDGDVPNPKGGIRHVIPKKGFY